MLLSGQRAGEGAQHPVVVGGVGGRRLDDGLGVGANGLCRDMGRGNGGFAESGLPRHHRVDDGDRDRL